ncbi:MAG: hydrogenase expression/formation protein [Gammaproteobacteria bacterium]|nr:hydrogenase expression/formation protein [Gammaproteobacteria bacterium]
MSTTSVLNGIPIEVAAGPPTYPTTGNDLPILHEIGHALRRLASQNESTVIDLQAIPMAPGEEQRILRLLGQGEVKATLDALGQSDVIETNYPGVWTVEHRNTHGETVGKYIEITHCPDILCSQEADIKASVERIGETLSELELKSSGGSA